MNTALLLEAGRFATARGWQSPDIVPVSRLLISDLTISHFASRSFDEMLIEHHPWHPAEPTPLPSPPEPVALTPTLAQQNAVCCAGFAAGDAFCGNCGTPR